MITQCIIAVLLWSTGRRQNFKPGLRESPDQTARSFAETTPLIASKMVLFRRVRWHNPFDYDLAPANQEELMTMIYPLEKVAKEPARGREGMH